MPMPTVGSTATAEPVITSTAVSTPAPAETATGSAEQHGGQIAYVKDDQIWLLDLATNESRQLTTEGQNSSPAWSPDGQTLAFMRIYGKNPEIVTMSADASQVTRLTDTPTFELVPAYGRDGALFFARKDQGDEADIQVIKRDAAGTESVVHTQPGGLCSPVHLSVGEANQVALSVNCGRGYNVFLIDVAAQKTTDISFEYAPTSCVYQGTWAHKAPRLAVITALDCSPQINTGISALNVEGAQPQMEEIITNREIQSMDWAPDDQAMIFARHGVEADLIGLWLLPLEGNREPRQVLKEGAEPAWRPTQR
jgi:dipeptidyl aminopeptidase/acylaminoacyl peptidase